MNCRVCNSSELQLFYTQGNKNEYKFYTCSNCNLVNLDIDGINTVNNQEKYALKYPDPYDKKKNAGPFNTYCFIKKNIGNQGSFLDIGCGNGSLLHFAKEDGWTVCGLELSPFLAENVKKELNIDVSVANFLDYNNESNKHDLVTLRHVLEHLPDSILAMSKINNLLVDGGKAILEFPNISGFNFSWKRALTRIGLYRKKYPNNYAPGHCNEFNKKSFTFLANKTGFKVLKWQTYSSKKKISGLLRLFPVGTKARVLIEKTN